MVFIDSKEASWREWIYSLKCEIYREVSPGPMIDPLYKEQAASSRTYMMGHGKLHKAKPKAQQCDSNIPTSNPTQSQHPHPGILDMDKGEYGPL